MKFVGLISRYQSNLYVGFQFVVQESVRVRDCMFIINTVNFMVNIFAILAFNTEKAGSFSNLQFGAWMQLTHTYEPFIGHVRMNNTTNYTSYPRSHNVFFILAERICSPYDLSRTSAKCHLLSDSLMYIVPFYSAFTSTNSMVNHLVWYTPLNVISSKNHFYEKKILAFLKETYAFALKTTFTNP